MNTGLIPSRHPTQSRSIQCDIGFESEPFSWEHNEYTVWNTVIRYIECSTYSLCGHVSPHTILDLKYINKSKITIQTLKFGVPLFITGPVSGFSSPGILPILMTQVNCDGSESKLINCSYVHVDSTSSCRHSRDVAIHCQPGKP